MIRISCIRYFTPLYFIYTEHQLYINYNIQYSYPPFYDENPLEIYKKITIGYYEFPADIALVARKLISSLIEPDISKRLGCLSVIILYILLITDVEWC